MDFSHIHDSLKQEVMGKISDIISKGDFILGEEVARFEREFASYCGAKYCIGVSSGSDALNLALYALGIANKDIITVSNTFVATVDCIIRNNNNVHFVDVDKNTLQMDASKIEKEITDNTKAIIPVNLFGSMPDWKQIKEISQKHSLLLVEDACQAHGSRFNGRQAGKFGDLACFSFYPGKNLGAFGDGGAIITDNEELRDTLVKLRNYGQSIKYYHDMVGFNSRLDTIQASILSVKLRYLDQWIGQKRAIARIYCEELDKIDHVRIPFVPKEVFHSNHLFPIITDNRDRLQDFLKANGITTGIHYPIPIHRQKGYSNHCFYSDLTVTELSCSKILSLPIYPGMEEEQAIAVCDVIRKFWGQ